MSESNWRHTLGRVPVLGNLVTGLRGVYSLRAWRAALRQDIADLRRDLQTLTDRTQAWREDLQSQEARLLKTLDERDAQARERHAQAREVDRAERLAWMHETGTRLNAALERGERRLEAGVAQEAQIRAALSQLQSMLRESQRSPGRAGAATVALPPSVPAASALAALADDQDAASWREWLTPLDPDAQVLLLPDEAPDGWTQGLRAVASGSLGGIAVPAGVRHLDAAAMRAVALAAAAALAPGASLVIRLDNPENAVVAAALCQAGPGVVAWTPEALAQVLRDAGFADVALWRLDAAEPPIAGEGEATAALNRLLAGPRRFIAVATRGD